MLKRVYTQGTASLRNTIDNDANLKEYQTNAFELSPIYEPFASFGRKDKNKQSCMSKMRITILSKV